MVGAGLVEIETDSAFIEISAEVVYASLVFKKIDDMYRSAIELDIQVIDYEQPDRLIATVNVEFEIADSTSIVVNSQEAYTIKRSIPVDPGSYKVRVIVRDASNGRESFESYPLKFPIQANNEVT